MSITIESTSGVMVDQPEFKSTAFLGSEGVYMLPHHAKEIERLTKQHHFMMSTTAGQLLASHVTAGNGPLRVLDAGCADGTWLRSLRGQFPGRELELHGVDIGSALFPPPAAQARDLIDLRAHNVVEPLPRSWGWHGSFDVVHQRLLVWALKRQEWSTVINNYLEILKPGGYLHLVEIEFISKTDPAPDTRPQLQKQAEMQKWCTATFGMDIDVAYHLEDWLKEAGFEDVEKVQFDHGYGALAADPTQRDVSAELWVECFRTVDTKIGIDGIPGVAASAAQFHKFLDDLEVEIKAFGYQPKLNFVFARKPMS